MCRRGLYATDRAGVGAGVLKNEKVIHCCSRTEGEADQEQGTLKSNERRNTVQEIAKANGLKL